MNQYRHIGPCLHKFANLDFSDNMILGDIERSGLTFVRSVGIGLIKLQGASESLTMSHDLQ